MTLELCEAAARSAVRRYPVLEYRQVLGVAWEAMSRAERRLDRSKTPQQQSAYLYRAALNAARSAARGLMRSAAPGNKIGDFCHIRGFGDVYTDGLMLAHPDPDTLDHGTTPDWSLDELLAQSGLTDRERGIACVAWVEGRSLYEAVPSLAATPQAARAALHRAKTKVTRRLHELGYIR